MSTPDDDAAPTSLMAFWCYFWSRRTTFFGYIVIALGAMATSDVFAPAALKWILLANGILTSCLGHYNAFQIRKSQGDPAPLAPPPLEPKP
jgi:hypothetical protein